MTEVTNRPAAVALAAAAIGAGGLVDLRDVLEAAGVVSAPTGKRKPAAPPAGRYRARHPCGSLRPLRDSAPARARAPYGLCPVGVCENPAPSPGWPCGECVAALGGHLRLCVAGAAA